MSLSSSTTTRRIRNSLQFSLVIEGFAVSTYSGAQELLGQAVTAGVRLPDRGPERAGMCGLDLIAALRARRMAKTPAILITSHPNAQVLSASSRRRPAASVSSRSRCLGGPALLATSGFGDAAEPARQINNM